MKVKILGRISQNPDRGWQAPVVIGSGPASRVVQVDLDAGYDPKSLEPAPLIDGTDLWSYRGTVAHVSGGEELSPEERNLKIKHAVLRHDKAFSRMLREIQAFENIERTDGARRERISEAVRLFVWQRDQGRCVQCGSSEKLEFDHVIPIAKGGGNTERNIQLLCEQCNRSKGANI